MSKETNIYKKETFDPIKSFEPVTWQQIDLVIQGIGGPIAAMVCGLNEVDIEAGAGVISRTSKCLWTTEGKRITVSLLPGGAMAACSREPDPAYPRAT